MSLIAFLDIRFGDPVVSLSMNSEGLVFGSMMGRIIYYHFSSYTERLITDISDENIAGAWLSPENILYAAIGDIKGLVVASPQSERHTKRYIHFDREHTSSLCKASQVQLYRNNIFLATLEPDCESEILTSTTNPIILIDLSTETQKTLEGFNFSHYNVFFDYDGTRLLFMEYKLNKRTLFLYKLEKTVRVIKELDREFGYIGFCKMFKKKILFVHERKTIKIMNKKGNHISKIGKHDNYIVALGVVSIEHSTNFREKSSLADLTEEKRSIDRSEFKVRSSEIIISADCSGVIRLWDGSQLIEEILISGLSNLTEKYKKFQYFSMGYPYYITMFDDKIAISTDIGVLLISSKRFQAI